MTVTATLNQPAGTGGVEVTLTAGGSSTATATDDYTLPAAFTIGLGRRSATADVTIVDDNVDEDNETIVLTTTVSGLTVTAVTLTITDNDAAPVLSIGSPSVAEGDSGTADLEFVVSLAGRTSRQVKVAYADATTGTATSGTDYTAVTAGTLTFAAGETAKTVTVAVTGDTVLEQNETVVLRLSSPSNATLKGGVTELDGTGTITNDEEPELSISSPSVAEGDSGTADLEFVVSLAGGTSRQVTVAYADSGDGTATSGTDYTAVTAGTLTFAAGDTAKTVTVAVTGDTVLEQNETVVLRLSSPSNATLKGGVTELDGTGTITNDEEPELSISSPSVAEGDSGTADLEFVVSLAGGTSRQVTVAYADSGDGTATSGTDYTAVTAGTLTFADGDSAKTVTVTVTADTVDEPNETVVLELSSASNATLSGGAATLDGTGTINDDDPAPELSISSPSVAEGDSGTADLEFLVSLSGSTSRQVTVAYADSGEGTATSGTDYTAGDGGNADVRGRGHGEDGDGGGDGGHGPRAGRDGGAAAVLALQRDAQGRSDRTGRDGHDHQRRGAGAVDQFAKRGGGRQRDGGSGVCGVFGGRHEPAGDGGVRGHREGDGDVGDGLHGGDGGDADVRGRGQREDGDGGGDGGHGPRAARDGGAAAVLALERDAQGRSGHAGRDGHDHQRRGAGAVDQFAERGGGATAGRRIWRSWCLWRVARASR